MKPTLNARLTAATALAFALALAGCNQSQAAHEAATGDAGAGSVNAGLVTVPENQMAKVELATARQTNWPRELRLTGNVDYNAFTTTPVISQVSGPVTRILVTPGQQVQAGETLLEISSPDFAAARDTYLKARDALALAAKQYSRAHDLYQHQAIAQADLEVAESAQTQAQADLESAEQNLRILGIPQPGDTSQVSPLAMIPLKAPVAGEIVERDVSPGQLLQGGATQCFVISNMKTVWVLANVYQNDLGYVHQDDPVAITADAFPQTLHGRIQYISPALDPNSRTLQARIETENPGGVLKRQMYVNATVTAGTLTNIVTVPDAAVLRDDQNVPFVYVQAGAKNQFSHRTVSLGASQNGFTQIASGLRAGEVVAADGSLFIQFATSFQN